MKDSNTPTKTEMMKRLFEFGQAAIYTGRRREPRFIKRRRKLRRRVELGLDALYRAIQKARSA